MSQVISNFSVAIQKIRMNKRNRRKKSRLIKAVVKLIRAYSNVANEMHKLGYSESEANKIKRQVQYYSDLRETIKQASGDYLRF